MNPLSDWFVDDRAIVDQQQRLFDEAGYRRPHAGQIDATIPRRAGWAWRYIVVVIASGRLPDARSGAAPTPCRRMRDVGGHSTAVPTRRARAPHRPTRSR
jgi:hypothetical protein